MFFKKKQKKFQEADNTAVFTTKYVIRDKKPITFVTHEEEDGAWQFFSSNEFENFEQVAMIVGLVEIIAIDASLLELADMPVGHYAIRETVNDNWSIRRQTLQTSVKGIKCSCCFSNAILTKTTNLLAAIIQITSND